MEEFRRGLDLRTLQKEINDGSIDFVRGFPHREVTALFDHLEF
jgi:hypothetical protein